MAQKLVSLYNFLQQIWFRIELIPFQKASSRVYLAPWNTISYDFHLMLLYIYIYIYGRVQKETLASVAEVIIWAAWVYRRGPPLKIEASQWTPLSQFRGVAPPKPLRGVTFSSQLAKSPIHHSTFLVISSSGSFFRHKIEPREPALVNRRFTVGLLPHDRDQEKSENT